MAAEDPDPGPASDQPSDPPPQHEPDAPAQPWWEDGEEPDYRATLANERTFLAWTRTSLAMLAGALAVQQLIQVHPYPLRIGLSFYLIAIAVGMTVVGYRQWRVRQHRMRRSEPLGRGNEMAVVAFAMLALAVIVAVIAALTPR